MQADQQDIIRQLKDRPMLADRVMAAWQGVDAGTSTAEQYETERLALMEEYARFWRWGLAPETMENPDAFERALVTELAELEGIDYEKAHSRCLNAVAELRDEWHFEVAKGAADAEGVERFYDKSQAYLYDLTWWHTLKDDETPLGYVSGAQLALREGCKNMLDFGSGVGTGALFFEAVGIRSECADISSSMLEYCARRFARRKIPGVFIDLKATPLQVSAYDFVAAMDVFEHVASPEEEAAKLIPCLAPGGILFGRFHSEEDDDRPQHIAGSFDAMFALLKSEGFEEIWRDQWIWGHQAFQKPR